jgi:hypothetical protein
MYGKQVRNRMTVSASCAEATPPLLLLLLTTTLLLVLDKRRACRRSASSNKSTADWGMEFLAVSLVGSKRDRFAGRGRYVVVICPVSRFRKLWSGTATNVRCKATFVPDGKGSDGRPHRYCIVQRAATRQTGPRIAGCILQSLSSLSSLWTSLSRPFHRL